MAKTMLASRMQRRWPAGGRGGARYGGSLREPARDTPASDSSPSVRSRICRTPPFAPTQARRWRCTSVLLPLPAGIALADTDDRSDRVTYCCFDR